MKSPAPAKFAVGRFVPDLAIKRARAVADGNHFQRDRPLVLQAPKLLLFKMEHNLNRNVSMFPSSRFLASDIRRIAMRIEKALWAASAAFVLASGFVASAQSASARVVCNREGDCWTTHANVRYPREFGIRVYNDRYADQHYRDRRWHASNRKWHDEGHDHDRGAYRNGQWVTF